MGLSGRVSFTVGVLVIIVTVGEFVSIVGGLVCILVGGLVGGRGIGAGASIHIASR